MKFATAHRFSSVLWRLGGSMRSSSVLLGLGFFFATILFAALASSCKKNPEQYSRLQVITGEESFSQDACRKNIGMARYSEIRIGSRTVAMLSPNYCVNRFQSPTASGKSQGFSLSGPLKNRAKPVFVHYGYAGNADHDSLIHQGGDQMISWAKDSGYRVLNVSGLDLGSAQKVIAADRLRNPQDYVAGGHVTFNVDAHGGTDENGIHRIYSSSAGRNSRTNASLRTTDVLGAFVSSAGSNVGTVVCNVQSCSGSDTIDDPSFEKLRKNPANPDQMRVFHFGGGRNTPSTTPWDLESGPQDKAKIEQATMLMLQNANPERGLTVERFREIEKNTDLRNTKVETTTYFVPNGPGVVSDTGAPWGRESHKEAVFFDEGAQAPTIVGPSEAFLIPPGVATIQGYKPVLGKKGINDEIKSLPSQSPGGIMIDNDGLSDWSYPENKDH